MSRLARTCILECAIELILVCGGKEIKGFEYLCKYVGMYILSSKYSTLDCVRAV